ncbi:hypothetical protein Q1J52_24755 [Pseudomonas lijiangensis]|uniref:hypothetical protein n=1 Tax=Pseudomonas syringae group TaxID=136849 RepID=UPI001910F07A|nr:hypothetical protein [Pseudomonas cichorii]GFM66173.1 hypothetical protein PSCICJ_22910 [Pseudomonas cichorii]
MEELQNHLNKLPSFLKAELTAQAGNTNGLSELQVIRQYCTAADQLINSKRAGLAQEHVNAAVANFGGTPWSKEDLELSEQLRNMPGIRSMDPYSMSINAHFFLESNRFLNELKPRMKEIEARLVAEQAQRQAAEAARLQAQRAAEEAARIKAEEEARELARRQIEEAKQAALALARRQVEEAAQALATRQAQDKAVDNQPQVTNQSVAWVPGPETSQQITLALSNLGASIEAAIMAFHEALQPHANLSDSAHFDEVLKMSQAAA